MSIKRVKTILDALEEKGELEFKENETILDWIRRINAQMPDPWASVKMFRVEAWVKRHLIKKRTNLGNPESGP